MMTQREAIEPIEAVRGQQVVITTMSSSGIWPTISDTPLDFAYIPSSMGQGISLGLGLALAKPYRGVIVIMGDGSLLMSLGSLVTVANHPAPLHVVLLDNGLYEVTGGQPVAGAGKTDFAGLAAQPELKEFTLSMILRNGRRALRRHSLGQVRVSFG